MSVIINNVNGIIQISSDVSQAPRCYYGAGGTSGKFYPIFLSGFDGFLINIGGDSYELKWENLVIDGVSPESLSEAQVLLAALFTS
jgi:hypothetical protein